MLITKVIHWCITDWDLGDACTCSSLKVNAGSSNLSMWLQSRDRGDREEHVQSQHQTRTSVETEREGLDGKAKYLSIPNSNSRAVIRHSLLCCVLRTHASVDWACFFMCCSRVPWPSRLTWRQGKRLVLFFNPSGIPLEWGKSVSTVNPTSDPWIYAISHK
jgi:hypothetical protein